MKPTSIGEIYIKVEKELGVFKLYINGLPLDQTSCWWPLITIQVVTALEKILRAQTTVEEMKTAPFEKFLERSRQKYGYVVMEHKTVKDSEDDDDNK